MKKKNNNKLKKFFVAAFALSACVSGALSVNSFAEEGIEPRIDLAYKNKAESGEDIYVGEGTKTDSHGKVTYTAATNTIEISGTGDYYRFMEIEGLDDVNIVIHGINNMAIYSFESINISGDGVLDCSDQFATCVETYYSDPESDIEISGDVTIKHNMNPSWISEADAEIEEMCAGVENCEVGRVYVYGIYSAGKTTINGGNFDFSGIDYGFGSSDIAINNGDVSVEDMYMNVIDVSSWNKEGSFTLGPNMKIQEQNIKYGNIIERITTENELGKGEYAVYYGRFFQGDPNYIGSFNTWFDEKNLLTNGAKTVHISPDFENTLGEAATLTFNIAEGGEEEQKEGEDSKETKEEETPTVPNTGLFTKDGTFGKILPAGIFAGIIVVFTTLKLSASRAASKRRIRKF